MRHRKSGGANCLTRKVDEGVKKKLERSRGGGGGNVLSSDYLFNILSE